MKEILASRMFQAVAVLVIGILAIRIVMKVLESSTGITNALNLLKSPKAFAPTFS